MAGWAVVALKLAGILLSSGLGIWGVTYTISRSKRRKRLFAFWIAVGALVAGGAEIFQKVANDVAGQKGARISEAILDRLDPIGPIEVGFEVSVPLEHARLAGFRRGLSSAVDEYLGAYERDGFPPGPYECNGITWNLRSVNGTIERVCVSEDSQVWSRARNSEFASAALLPHQIQVALYRHPRPLGQIDCGAVPGRSANAPDVRIMCEGQDRWVFYRPQATGLEVDYWTRPITASEWEANGRILSVPDLLGAQIIVTLSSPVALFDGSDADLSIVRRRVALLRLRLDVGHRQILLGPGSLREQTTRDGLPCWEYTFPQTLDELASLRG